MRFWYWFRVLRRHRVFIASLVTIVTVAAATILYVYPEYPKERYESVARVLVTPPGYEATQLNDETRPWNFGVNQDEIFTTTMAEMLKSDTVLARAARSLPADQESLLSQSVAVDPIKAPKQGVELLTHVIEVRSRARTPEQAQRNTDALLAAFTAFHSEAARTQAEKERSLIAEETESARVRSEEARSAIETFKEENGFIDLDRNATALADQYLSAQAKLFASEEGVSRMGQRRELATERLMDRTLAEIHKLPSLEAQLAELTIERDVADEAYRRLNSKLLEADVSTTINAAAGQVGVLDSASLPELPVGFYEPRGPLGFVPPFDYRKVLVLVAALVLSGSLAFARVILGYLLDDRIRNGHDAAGLTGLPLLGEIPATSSKSDAAIDGRRDIPCRESYNAAGAHIANYIARGGKPLIAIVGAKTQEGRTTVVVALGRALADAGMRVVMVDADLRGRRLSRLFDVAEKRGLQTAVLRDAAVETIAASTDQENLLIVPTGADGTSPIAVVNSPRFEECLRELAREADVVLIDTPPALAFADAAFIARHADAAVFVMRADASPARNVYEDSLKELRSVNDSFIGVVIVGVERDHCENAYHLGLYRESEHDEMVTSTSESGSKTSEGSSTEDSSHK